MGNAQMKFKYLFFLLEKTNDFFWREECIDFKRNLTDSTLIKKKKMSNFTWLKEFH